MADTEHETSETTTTPATATTAAPTATAFPPQTGLVRRLHVIETCRLMGFPDDYLDVDGEETKDAPRYKACGNSWAVNCAEFVNARIERALRESGVVADGEAVRYATTCSGVEAHSLSVRGADWSPQFFSEIEKFPCRVLAHRYPSVPNLGDMTAVDGTKFDLHVFSGGTPCFTAGNMVLTKDGYRPIEDIRVGDLVMTHQGRLRRVSAVGKKLAKDIVEVKCAATPPVRCTSGHKFWSPLNPHRDNRRHAPTYCKTVFDGMAFRPIADIGKGGYVSRLCEYERIAPPKIPCAYHLTSRDIVEIAGWYVGDGHCAGFSEKKHKRVLILSLNAEKVAAFEERFGDRLNYTVTKHTQGVWRVQVANKALCEWLVANFGHHAQEKRIPAWLIAADDDVREAFVAGYMATDGFSFDRFQFAGSTTSFALALGLSDIVRKCAIYRSKVAPKKVMFDGRVVNQHDFWNVRKSHDPKRFHDFEKWANVRVAEIEKCAPEVVYNITVEDDHGYVVNGLCVSNCQSLSVAGKRHGMAEGSGTRSSLAFHWLRIANEANARVALWENVPGAFSTNGGRDFAWFVHRLCESGWGVAWRTLDAQFCFSWTFPRAIPQRRRRIWLVAVRGGDWKTAAKILFERTSAASAVAPLRVLGDGTVVREEARRGGGASSPADDAADTPFSRQSRADWLPDGFFGDGDALTGEQSRAALGRLGEVRYCGRMFGGDADLFSNAGGGADAEAEQTPENIRDDFLKALGAGSGVAVGTSAAALKTAMWPGGIQPPWRVLAERGEGFEPPPGFDGTVCGLSDILLPWSEKVSHLILSERACAGIVRRASQRGKELKKVLSDALAGQIASWQSGALDGVAKKGKAR